MGQTSTTTYDAVGNVVSTTDFNGQTNTNTYDVDNRLIAQHFADGSTTTYTYTPTGQQATVNGTSETEQYDALNRLVELENDGPGGVISSYRYTLAANGRRDAVVEDTGRTVNYQYDALDRLIEELITNPDSSTRKIDYTYDPVGNRMTMVDSVQGETDYKYDANDRLMTETTSGVVTTYKYDNNGNTLSKYTSAVDQAIYEWDSQNRMIGAQVTDSSGTTNVSYKYDSNGIRVSSIVNGAETRYLIDTVQPYAEVLEEYSPGGAIQVSYVYGNELISQNRGGTTSFYAVDGLGSTRALTNSAGVVTDRYVYDAFGQIISQSGSTVNNYLFAGQQWDPSVGLVYLRARYLSVDSGRFLDMDSFSGFENRPLTLDGYSYANLNPVNLVDPGGNWTLPDVTAATVIQSILAVSNAYFLARNVGEGVYDTQRAIDSFLADDNQSGYGYALSAVLHGGLAALSVLGLKGLIPGPPSEFGALAAASESASGLFVEAVSFPAAPVRDWVIDDFVPVVANALYIFARGTPSQLKRKAERGQLPSGLGIRVDSPSPSNPYSEWEVHSGGQGSPAVTLSGGLKHTTSWSVFSKEFLRIIAEHGFPVPKEYL
jgi:RHS repeat-associated protein